MAKSILRQEWLGLAVIAVLGFVVMATLRPSFLTPFNLFVLMSTFALATLIALGQMVTLAVGQLNLSLGSVGGLVAVSFAGLMDVWHWSAAPSLMAGLALGALAGALNGILIAQFELSAFIVTLATLAMFKGLNLALTKAQPFYHIDRIVSAFGNASIGGPIPAVLIPTVMATAVVAFIFYRLPIGRQILAVGGNSSASELSGISNKRAVITAHVMSGALAGLAGMVAVARLQLGQPTIGEDWLISSFAAPVIGGVALTGGHVSIVGTLLAVVIVALITQGLVLFAVDPFYVQLVLGGLILVAVGLNSLRSLLPIGYSSL
ncbi:monosaccharide ABC transporter membrane protein (CUT2 family) [Roseiarcus fermentans]|uniref:Monosaccharide ABC transporter membrane protein (CUT2 family) n=1 Tax=Roseiarcus fermentans TaxID=1473586 RepID=A0A366EY49_9HYPH|nr:ABC transporter permease [Roseiarcus fermentans]RBP07307.1 monosaccharide ABC transporter membrane protein (CUT2 family) [Roseiarcus fermentans]